MKKEKTIVSWVRVPESWNKEIKKIAKVECRTQASIIRQAIKEYLDKVK